MCVCVACECACTCRCVCMCVWCSCVCVVFMCVGGCGYVGVHVVGGGMENKEKAMPGSTLRRKRDYKYIARLYYTHTGSTE